MRSGRSRLTIPQAQDDSATNQGRRPQTGRAYWIYILHCDDRLYAGVATDPRRRLKEHVSRGSKAAKFMRLVKSIRMAYARQIGDKGLALRVEYRIKQLSRQRKLRILQDKPRTKNLLRQLGL